MSGSTLGNHFKITTWGESHGKAIGVVIDGCPSSLPLTEEDIQPFLNRRKPGQSKFTTQRKEGDQVQILSGTFKGLTTGTPISLLIPNEDQHSRDYSNIKDVFRPGHADFTFEEKYGIRDYRGGGRSSGRETIGRVAAGAIAMKILNTLGITFKTYTTAIGPVSIDTKNFDFEESLKNPLCMPDANAAKEAESFLENCMKESNSTGGIIECCATGLPVGIGQPVFDKLDANLAKAMLSIGAVKGFEIGDGFLSASSTGRENNDAFTLDENKKIQKETNHSGGVLGGMSDGAPLLFRVAIKPTPSIFSPQQTVSKDLEQVELKIQGRHDPVIVPRAVVVVEAMAALTILDLLLENMGSKLSSILEFYKK